MDVKQYVFGVIGTILLCSKAIAGEMGPIVSSIGLHPVLSLQSGYASINTGGGTQRFIGTDSDVFTYTNSNNAKNTGFIGVFLGAEHELPWVSRPGFFMQMGVEYNYFGNIGIKGINTVGVEPQTSTNYNYNYNF